MSGRNLAPLLAPRSVAVIGASDRPQSVGATVMQNLLRGGFSGPIWPVNVKHRTVYGIPVHAAVDELPAAPDLAVICTPAQSVPQIVAALGARGTRAAVVLSAGLERPGDRGHTLQQAMLEAAEPFALRILGPNCIGLLVPGVGLNASFAHVGASPGSLAFVAQSGALTTAMLDWAQSRQIGFSHFISLGNAADVDFGDLLGYLGQAGQTRAILLYVESITGARKFLAAARAAARNKPVIVVKAGRSGAAAHAATSHSGALAGSDAVYEAAFRRAGVLRVTTMRELFEAAEILAHPKPYLGPRLAIVSNGGGPAVMATDALIAGGGELAELHRATLDRLDAVLPPTWSHANPLDIVGDAPPQRYAATLDAVLGDPNVDAVLVIHAPTAIASVAAAAEVCLPLLAGARAPALACWLGAERTAAPGPHARRVAVPAYATGEEAVAAFLHLARYHAVQTLLLQAPSSQPPELKPDVSAVRSIVDAALAQGRNSLTEPQSKAILEAYGIPIVPTRIARDAAEAQQRAGELGYPVALKILSQDITHKSDVGGVALDLGTPRELEAAAAAMLARCRELCPKARLEGFTVQKMVRRGSAHELLAGIALDATFGPTIVFGQGGTAVEVIGDRALALPPLNALLARDLMSQTRVWRLLCGYRQQPAVDLAALEGVLVKLAQLAVDTAELVELDINPLLADEHGVLALDARIRLAPASGPAVARLAIRPYPAELEEEAVFEGCRTILRPIRPEDLTQHREFLARVSPEDRRARFFSAVRELPEADLAHLTQIDYEREMAFIATRADPTAHAETLGVARACADADNIEAEFAVLVRSDLQRRGLGTRLLRKLITYCRARGVQRLVGEVLADNTRMLRLAASLGFQLKYVAPGTVRLSLELSPA
jgi:acetyltransferase